MLEKYVEDLDAGKFTASYAKKKGITIKKALAEFYKKIPRESYYQDKIKKALTRKYPDAFVRKISQGAYSEAGTPDIMCIYQGHYFGFEIKRPIIGKPTRLQIRTIELIRKAGGTAACVSWPEEAIRMVEEWRFIAGELPWITEGGKDGETSTI